MRRMSLFADFISSAVIIREERNWRIAGVLARGSSGRRVPVRGIFHSFSSPSFSSPSLLPLEWLGAISRSATGGLTPIRPPVILRRMKRQRAFSISRPTTSRQRSFSECRFAHISHSSSVYWIVRRRRDVRAYIGEAWVQKRV